MGQEIFAADLSRELVLPCLLSGWSHCQDVYHLITQMHSSGTQIAPATHASADTHTDADTHTGVDTHTDADTHAGVDKYTHVDRHTRVQIHKGGYAQVHSKVYSSQIWVNTHTHTHTPPSILIPFNISQNAVIHFSGVVHFDFPQLISYA